MPSLSKAEREIILQKHELTKRLREEYQKQYSNPYRHGFGMGGGVVSNNTKLRIMSFTVNIKSIIFHLFYW